MVRLLLDRIVLFIRRMCIAINLAVVGRRRRGLMCCLRVILVMRRLSRVRLMLFKRSLNWRLFELLDGWRLVLIRLRRWRLREICDRLRRRAVWLGILPLKCWKCLRRFVDYFSGVPYFTVVRWRLTNRAGGVLGMLWAVRRLFNGRFTRRRRVRSLLVKFSMIGRRTLRYGCAWLRCMLIYIGLFRMLVGRRPGRRVILVPRLSMLTGRLVLMSNGRLGLFMVRLDGLNYFVWRRFGNLVRLIRRRLMRLLIRLTVFLVLVMRLLMRCRIRW